MSQSKPSRFKVEAAVVEVEETAVSDGPSHSVNGTQPNHENGQGPKIDFTGPMKLLKTPREIKLKFTVMCLFVLILVGTILILVYYKEEPLNYVVGTLTYYVDTKEMVIKYDQLERLRGEMGMYTPDMLPATCPSASEDTLCIRWRDYGKLRIDYNRSLSSRGMDCYTVGWDTYAPDTSLKDCFSVKNSHWYGGSVTKNQNLPLESMNFPLTAFITSDRDEQYGSVVERYWLATRGVSVRVEDTSPLLVSMDRDEQQMCVESMYWDSVHYHHNTTDSHLEYFICVSNNLVELFNMTKPFPTPSTIPDISLLSDPVWSLDVSSSTEDMSPFDIVKEFQQIHGKGLVDIRSGFSLNEGDLRFDDFGLNDSFVRYVQDLGMMVSAGVTPYVSVESVAFKDGALSGSLVKDPRGEVPGLTMWNEEIGGVVDITEASASQSYKSDLLAFKDEQGLDYLTFDYGEASYLPYGYQISTELDDPSEFTQRYIDIATSVSSTVIARSAYQNQDAPIIIRTYAKEATWDVENGFGSVIPSVINLGIIGYPFMALDINSSSFETMDKELFVSYMQISACLPVMQIPSAAVKYDTEVKNLVKSYIGFHNNKILPIVTKLGQEFLSTGLPIIRPVWWLGDNSEASMLNSQFLVGNDLLIAPKMHSSESSRQVYLPPGKWFQPGTGVLYGGNKWEEIVFRMGEIPFFERRTDQ